MKKLLLFMLAFAFGFSLTAQNQQLKKDVKFTKAPALTTCGQEIHQASQNQTPEINPPGNFKNTDVVNIVSLGTTGNAYGYFTGIGGGKAAVLDYNQELNTLTFIHGMGGDLDPGGSTYDFGYDISTDGGETWTTMIELYQDETYFGLYPRGGIFNPTGNTNPDEAYMAYNAKIPGVAPGDYDGYVFGRGKIGDIADTTRNFIFSNPGQGVFLDVAQGFTLDNNGQMWMVSYNQDWSSGSLEWLQEIVVTKCTWNTAENDFEFDDQFLLECPSESRPADIKVEFSPDGSFGYIAALTDIGTVPVSNGMSFYPILWRTEDGGETWEGPITVALAGENGVTGVQYYLNNDELAEIYDPVPPRDEIPFTTAYDFDLTVDAYGNPHIAVVVGITGEDPYSIITDISPSSGYMYTAAMLLSSFDLGEPGSWEAGVMGKSVSFRGSFGDDMTEDNRIQIARSISGEQVFVTWLDTDTTVSAENNAPDIWSRGVDLTTLSKTVNSNAEDLPTNVTFGSEATFSAYFFNMANQVIDDGNWSFTIPMVYLNMTPTDPGQPVQFKYIKDFTIDYDYFMLPAYLTVGIEETFAMENSISVSGVSPNPASGQTVFNINCYKSLTANIQITNLVGQNIKTLSRNLNVGNNEITLDISDLKSGIYFITIEAGGQTLTKKMMVE